MIMDRFSIWTGTTFLRKWLLERATKKYYQEYFAESRDKTVLEIGCGSGPGTKLVLKYFSPARIVATDLDPRQINLAKTRIKDTRVEFEAADATNLRFEDGFFDTVFDYGAIHHIPAPEWKKCLEEICRVLKRRGKVFIYDVSIESFDTFIGMTTRLITSHPYGTMYRKEEFISYLISLRFKILKRVDESRYFVIVAEKQ